MGALASRAGACVTPTSSAEDLARRVRGAVAEGCARVLVIGGDGTLHHAAQALVGARSILGIVPVGRGNDFARALGIPKEIPLAASAALYGSPKTVDVGVVAGRYFTTVAGVGIDAEVVRHVEGAARRLPGACTYPFALMMALRGFRPPALRIGHDTGVIHGRIMLAAVANTGFFGRGMLIAPGAVPNDGMLDLVVVDAISKLRLLTLFPRVYRGHHIGLPSVRVHRSRTVSMTSDVPLTVQADGERFSEGIAGSLEFGVMRGALLVAAGDLQGDSHASPVPFESESS